MRMVISNNKYNFSRPVLSVNYYDKASNPFNLNIVRKFSTKTTVLSASTLKGDFIEWLCGLIDGEGSFYINKKTNTTFSFRFDIHLHLDDKHLLDYLSQTLGIGKVYVSGDSCTFVVSKHEELQTIVDLLSNRPLNSTKYLNFLDFKKALDLYKNKKMTEEISSEIINLKGKMNSKRTEFKMPYSHKPLITKYWLLGFVEGEASFSVRRESNKFELIFSLSQSANDEVLMDVIKEYFENLSGDYSSDVVKKSFYKPKGINHKQVIQLIITQTDFIKNELIPFFSSLEWHSKKELDFKDWVTIFKLKERGHHYQEEGLKVLNDITNQMNNYRLSTNRCVIKVDSDQLLKDVNSLLEGPSNYEIVEDRKIIKSLNRLVGVGQQVKIQLEEQDGTVVRTFFSISDCAKFFNVSRSLIYARILKNKPILFGDKYVYIKKN